MKGEGRFPEGQPFEPTENRVESYGAEFENLQPAEQRQETVETTPRPQESPELFHPQKRLEEVNDREFSDQEPPKLLEIKGYNETDFDDLEERISNRIEYNDNNLSHV